MLKKKKEERSNGKRHVFFKDALHSFSSSVPHAYAHAQFLVVQTMRSGSMENSDERSTTLKFFIIQA